MDLPSIILLSNFGGSTEKFIDFVYQAYLKSLVHGNLTFLGKPIRFKYAPSTKGRGFAFWHAVQERGDTDAEDDRIIDLRRCERIEWAAYMLAVIEADGSKGDVLWWRNKRGGSTRIILWIPGESYAVVLDERKDHCMFWTTYLVRSGRAKAFVAEHASYWK